MSWFSKREERDFIETRERLSRVIGKRPISKFERDCGIGRGQIWRAIHDKKPLNSESISKICNSENISADWLLLGRGEMAIKNPGITEAPDFTAVPTVLNPQPNGVITDVSKKIQLEKLIAHLSAQIVKDKNPFQRQLLLDRLAHVCNLVGQPLPNFELLGPQ